MATPKPRYTDSAPIKRRKIKDNLRSRLLDLCPDNLDDTFPEAFGSEKESLVDEIMVEAAWAIDELSEIDQEITSQVLGAIRRDLLDKLAKCQKKLQTLIPEYEGLLDIETTPIKLSNALDPVISAIQSTDKPIADLGRSLSRVEKDAAVATEISVRIMKVLQDYGIKISATKSMEFDYVSTAVVILDTVGEAIGLKRHQTTWRDIILKAKKENTFVK